MGDVVRKFVMWTRIVPRESRLSARMRRHRRALIRMPAGAWRKIWRLLFVHTSYVEGSTGSQIYEDFIFAGAWRPSTRCLHLRTEHEARQLSLHRDGLGDSHGGEDMTDTLLVRAADGGWEELRPQRALPEGGLVDVLGHDLGPVLGLGSPVIVVAAAPALATGTPDAICVDADGGVWILQSAFDDRHDLMMPALVGGGGALTGMEFSEFQAICNMVPEGATLFDHVIASTGAAGTADAFQRAVSTTLKSGQFHLVGFVHDAPAAVVQSLRFLQAAGARIQLLHTVSFASASVHAIRATELDLSATPVDSAPAAIRRETAGSTEEQHDRPRAKPKSAAESPADVTTAPAPTTDTADKPADRLIAAAQAAGDEQSARLIGQLHDAASAIFDNTTFADIEGDVRMTAQLAVDGGWASVLTLDSDGGLVISFSELGVCDGDWSARAELSQGMERLLGTDLGDVKEIGQLNLSIREHLNDSTLIDVLVELLGEMVQSVQHGAKRAAAA